MGEPAMNYIILDFNGIKSLWTLHEYFKEVFNLPDYYGHNMDALWDCLDCSFEFPTTIVLKNIEKIPSEMNEATEIMLELFEDLQRDNEKVTVQIESNDFGDNSAFIV
jgi:ribonuclease inhibitor